MKDVRIYIDGEEVDIEQEVTPVDLCIFDIADIGKRKPIATKIIKAPATGNNKNIFNFLEDVRVNTTVSGISGRYISGSLEINGQVKFYESIIDKGEEYYRFQIISGNGDWVKLFNDILLTDIDFSEELNHTYNETNILASETAGYGYMYPLINYGEFIKGDEVVVEDRLPAVRLQTIIQKIFSYIGYKLSSSYLNGSDFQKYLITYSRNPNIYEDQFVDSMKFRASIDTTDSFSQEYIDQETSNLEVFSGSTTQNVDYDDKSSGDNFDNNNNYNVSTATFEIGTGEAGSYRFRSYLRVFYDIPLGFQNVDLYVKLEVLKDGITVLGEDENNTVNSYGFGYLEMEVDTGYYHIEEDTDITVKLTVTNSSLYNNSGATQSVYIKMTAGSGSYWYNEVLTRPAKGYEWTYDNLLPDISVIDFIKGIFEDFNLLATTNNQESTVYIEQYSDFYSGGTMDWSNKLDSRGKKVVEIRDFEGRRRYHFKRDGNDAKVVNTDILVTLSNGNTDEIELESKLFAQTIEDVCRDIHLNSTNIPKLWKEDVAFPNVSEQNMVYLPRLLEYNGQTSTGSDYYIFEGTTKYLYPKCDIVSMNTLVGYKLDSLFRLNNNKIFIAYFNLTDVDINNIINAVSDNDFRASVYIDKYGYFLINKIIGYKKDIPTKVELLVKRIVSTGVSSQEVDIIGDVGSSSIGGGGGTGGTSVSCPSYLITDANIIADITDETNWNNQNYIGSTVGLIEGNYYIDNNTKIKYNYDGSNLYRYRVNYII